MQIPQALPESLGSPCMDGHFSQPSLHKGHSTQDNDGGVRTQVTGLRGCGGKQRVASKEKWSGGASTPPLPSQGSLYSQIKPNCFTNYRSQATRLSPSPLPCQTAAGRVRCGFLFFSFLNIYIYLYYVYYIYIICKYIFKTI